MDCGSTGTKPWRTGCAANRRTGRSRRARNGRPRGSCRGKPSASVHQGFGPTLTCEYLAKKHAIVDRGAFPRAKGRVERSFGTAQDRPGEGYARENWRSRPAAGASRGCAIHIDFCLRAGCHSFRPATQSANPDSGTPSCNAVESSILRPCARVRGTIPNQL